MSQLATARRQLSSIKSLIRQEKFLSAVQTLRDAVITVFREPLMKAEKEEFERLISDASYHIVCDPHVRKAAALELKYVPGKEREFLDGLNMLLETFDGQFQDEARESARLLEEKRRQELERGQQKLDAGQVDAARAVFSILARENQENYELRVDIGERFLRAGEYEDAVQYLGEALEGMPGAAHIYNSLAVAQRRMGRYADAEQSYIKAAPGRIQGFPSLLQYGTPVCGLEKMGQGGKGRPGRPAVGSRFRGSAKTHGVRRKNERQRSVGAFCSEGNAD